MPKSLNVQKEARSGRIDILYVSPERLALDRFREFLRTLKIGLIAIDEAHCISEWGHDFRPDYRNLRTLRDEFPNAPVMALTATATEKVREDVAGQMDMVDAPRFVTSFNRANLTYRVRPKRRSFDTLVQLLRTPSGPTRHHLLLLPEGYGGTGEGPLAPRFQGVRLTTPVSRTMSAGRPRTASSATTYTSSRQPLLLGWASISPT